MPGSPKTSRPPEEYRVQLFGFYFPYDERELACVVCKVGHLHAFRFTCDDCGDLFDPMLMPLPYAQEHALLDIPYSDAWDIRRESHIPLTCGICALDRSALHAAIASGMIEV